MLTISIFVSLQDGSINDETIYEPLSIVNTLWSNTVLATGILPLLNVNVLTNLGSVMGVVIYTGHDTRSALHTSTPRLKVSSVNPFEFITFSEEWTSG